MVKLLVIVSTFSGGLVGVGLSEMIRLRPGAPVWMVYFWFVLLIAICGIIVWFFRWKRRQIGVARTGAWEPGVPPDDAMKTLRELWKNETRKTLWPGTARRALEGNKGFWGALREDKWLVFWRVGPWCLLVILLCLFVAPTQLETTVLVSVAVAAIAGTILSLWSEHAWVMWRIRVVKARFSHLTQKASEPSQVPRDEKEIVELKTAVHAILESQRYLQQQLDSLLESGNALLEPLLSWRSWWRRKGRRR